MKNIQSEFFNRLIHNVPKWSDAHLKILQQMLQDFQSVSDHFETLCIKRLNRDISKKKIKITLKMNEQEMFLQQALVLVTWPLIFVIHFIISSLASANNSPNYSEVILK